MDGGNDGSLWDMVGGWVEAGKGLKEWNDREN